MEGESRRFFLGAGGFNPRIEPFSTPNLRSPTHEASASRSLEVLKLLFTFWGGARQQYNWTKGRMEASVGNCPTGQPQVQENPGHRTSIATMDGSHQPRPKSGAAMRNATGLRSRFSRTTSAGFSAETA